MEKTFDLSQFDEYREDNRREVKKAEGGLPVSLWDTYSSFANCYGGVIILGVKENKGGSWRTTGLQNASKLRKELWDNMNNPNLINIGERAGSGVPNIFNVWEDEGWEEPVIEERFDPDRTVLTLSFKKSGDKKAAIKSGDKKVTKKTQMQYDKILAFMEEGKEYGIRDFCELLGLKESRTKDILKGLSDYIETVGSNRDRRYRKM